MFKIKNKLFLVHAYTYTRSFRRPFRVGCGRGSATCSRAQPGGGEGGSRRPSSSPVTGLARARNIENCRAATNRAGLSGRAVPEKAFFLSIFLRPSRNYLRLPDRVTNTEHSLNIFYEFFFPLLVCWFSLSIAADGLSPPIVVVVPFSISSIVFVNFDCPIKSRRVNGNSRPSPITLPFTFAARLSLPGKFISYFLNEFRRRVSFHGKPMYFGTTNFCSLTFSTRVNCPVVRTVVTAICLRRFPSFGSGKAAIRQNRIRHGPSSRPTRRP